MIHVTLPQLSLSMQEGRVLRWLVTDGVRVSAGQPIVEIETDKAISEMHAPSTGTIHLVASEGALVVINGVLAEIVEAGAHQVALKPSRDPVAAAHPGQPAPSFAWVPERTLDEHRRLRASPAARRMARERGIDISEVCGSGAGGRITVSDLGQIPAAERPSLREAVVANVTASWQQIPHIHIAGELDAGGLAAARGRAPAGVTVTDLLVLALVRTVRAVPQLNGTTPEGTSHVHVALAVDTPRGVVSPVIRDAHSLSLSEITRARARLVSAARAGASDPRDLAGGTITLSNLGAYPVDFFAPIISAPQIAMVATGRLMERPVVVDGIVAVGYRIWTNVSIDHRRADGASGARFLAAFEDALDELQD